MTAHNLRAPVAQLLGLAHIFDRNAEPNSFNAEVIRRIYDSTLSLDEVIRDIAMILHIKKEMNTNFAKIDPLALLKNILGSFKEEIEHKRIKIINKSPTPHLSGGLSHTFNPFSIISSAIALSIPTTGNIHR